jgi:ferredoxin
LSITDYHQAVTARTNQKNVIVYATQTNRSSRFMPTVTVEGEKSFEVEPGKKLVLAIEDAGIDIMHRCGGNARCTTCRVQILAGEAAPMEATEQERLARETDLQPNTRLSCQIRVESDLWVVVVNRASQTGIPAGTRPLD